MADNFLDQLSEIDVPPPPVEFDSQLHDRVNQSLLSVQLVELLVQVMPMAMLEMTRAFTGWVMFTLTGRYDVAPQDRGEKSPDEIS